MKKKDYLYCNHCCDSHSNIAVCHYAPVWVSITNLVALSVGVVLGWIANVAYNKFVKGKTEE